jgi:Zn-dependent membrane protease YugP
MLSLVIIDLAILVVLGLIGLFGLFVLFTIMGLRVEYDTRHKPVKVKETREE